MRGRFLYILLPALLLIAAFFGFALYSSSHKPGRPFDTRSDAVGAHDEAAARRYLGASACAKCHQEIYNKWLRSGHAQNMYIATTDVIKGDFTANNTFTYEGITANMFVRDGKYFMEVINPDSTRHTYQVHYTIGNRIGQWYLTKFPNGALQVLPALWDISSKEWYNLREGILNVDRKISQEELAFGNYLERSWNSVCWNCHASQMEKNYDPDTCTFDTQVVDLSINCESCHGPGNLHVQRWNSLGGANREVRGRIGNGQMVRLEDLPPSKSVDVCGQCHAKKDAFSLGYQPGDDILDFYLPLVLESEELFWPDGRYKAMNYNYLAHVQSECYTKGGLTCLGCHDPHGSENDVSLKVPANDNRLCTHCHVDIKLNLVEHTHHPPDDVSSSCVECHMPYISIGRNSIRDHRISSPIPRNTMKLNIPNACNKCHQSESALWARKWVSEWYQTDQEDRSQRTEAIYLGMKSDKRGMEGLIVLLQDKHENTVFRSSAAALLGRMNDQRVTKALVNALKDESPLVRGKAISALIALQHTRVSTYLQSLNDSNAYVRGQAAAAMSLCLRDPAQSELTRVGLMLDSAEGNLFKGAIGAYVDHQKLYLESPSSHLNLAVAYRLQGRLEESQREHDIAKKMIRSQAREGD